MSIKLNAHDDEIRAVEERIAADRDALADAIAGCGNSVRNAVSSPKSLLMVVGLGFAAGKILFRPAAKREEPKRRTGGWLGLLAGTAVSIMQPKFGVGTIARWAIQRMFRDRPATPVRSAAAARAWAGSRRGATAREAAREYGHTPL